MSRHLRNRQSSTQRWWSWCGPSRYAVPRRLNTPATFFEACEIAIRCVVPNACPRLPGL